jgi:hypothetical protein
MRAPRLLFSFIAVCVFAVAAFAQNRTAGGLSGRVQSDGGTPIAAATVQISSTALIGGPRETLTDAQGRFRFPDIAPGSYRITVSRPGFSTAHLNDVTVSVGLTAEVTVKMKLFGGAETIEVTADRTPIDTRTSSMPTILPSSLLRNIPIERDPSHMLNLAPGVNLESAYGGGEESGNAYEMDGVDVSDPQAGAPWSLFNYSLIDQVEVVGLGAPAEYGQFTGTVVNSITKSGSNEPSGSVEMFYAGQALAGNSLLEDLNASIDSDLEQSFQIGGPVRRDRLWYFASGQYHHLNSNEGGPTQREITPRIFFKLTSQPKRNAILHGWLQWDRTKVTGRNGDDFTPIEATNGEDNPELVGYLGWNSVLSENSILNIAWGGYTGHQHLNPHSGFNTPGHFDAQSGFFSVNSQEFGILNRSRMQLDASFTHYLAKFHGDHELKIGTELEHANIRDSFGPPGGVFYSDNEGPVIDPSTGKSDFYTLATIGGGYDAHGQNRRVSAYLQDSWQITPRFTLNPGLRLDMNRGNVTGGTVFKTSPIAPRLGFALDLGGDARTVLRGHYGRYYEALYAAFYYYTDPGAFAPLTAKRTFNTSKFTETLFTTPGQQYAIDPNIKQPYLDQLILGIDRQMPHDIVLSGTLVYRKNRNLIETVSRDGIFKPVTGKVPGSGQTVTLYDYLNPNTDVLIYTNPRGLNRTYRAAILSATRRLTGKWQLAASYVYSRATGNIDNLGFDELGLGANTPFFSGHFLDTPNSLVNAQGRLTHDQTQQVKLMGTRLFPRRHMSVSADYTFHSGDTWTPRANCLLVAGPNNTTTCHDFPQGPVVYFAEARGSRRLQPRSELDLRIEWQHQFRNARDLRIDLDFFNANNQQRVTSVETLIGPNFGEPATANYQRWLRLGFAWSW